jgi:uncharacterized protein (TIGR02001 family)
MRPASAREQAGSPNKAAVCLPFRLAALKRSKDSVAIAFVRRHCNRSNAAHVTGPEKSGQDRGQGMKKAILFAASVLAVLAAAPALAADMPANAVKAPAVAEPPSQWDVLFGVAFTTDYRLRGVSQSNKRPAVQGYFEVDFKAGDWVTLYTGVWGSSLWSGFADAEFDITGGTRFSWGNFGLDLGFVYYYYPDGVATSGSGSYGEFYAKPSYKFSDWLTVGAIVDGGNNFNDGVGIGGGGKTAYYYSANATLVLPFKLPYGVTTSLNGEIGRQVYDGNITRFIGIASYTYWDVGLIFNYKALTLDLRYWDTNTNTARAAQCGFTTGGRDACGATFVATLKFDTSLSALK